VILYDNSATDSIMRIAASGGVPVPVTKIDRARGETGNAWPQWLPDGRHFLYLALASRAESTALKVGDLRTGKTHVLLRGNLSKIEYVAPGYVLFVRDRALLAQRFDTGKLVLRGEPAPVVDDVAVGGGGASNAEFSASENGVLVFRGSAGTGVSRLTWVDRAGKELQAIGEPGAYSGIAPSPDGRRVAMENTQNGNSDIWILEAARNVMTRFTFTAVGDFWPVFSPDGSRIVYTSDRDLFGVWVKDASGASPESLLSRTAVNIGPCDWSQDGSTIACLVQSGNFWHIWLQPGHGGEARPLLTGQVRYLDPRFSPDGRWIAYSSNESGRREVYVQPYPSLSGKWQVSTAGGRDPGWRRDGKEIYYVSPSGAMAAVTVVASPAGSLDLGSPRTLFTGVGMDDNPIGHNYAVSPDGQRFLLKRQVLDRELPASTVYMNWTAALAKR
jgi:Tol biopolymer transport system component